MIGDRALDLASAAIILLIIAGGTTSLANAGRAILARIRRRDDWRARYTEYLRSPEWAGKRRRALARAGHRCENCGGAGPLDVHHKTYERLGRERADDLVVLCEACHQQADAQRAAIGRAKSAAAWATARARGLARWRRKHA